MGVDTYEAEGGATVVRFPGGVITMKAEFDSTVTSGHSAEETVEVRFPVDPRDLSMTSIDWRLVLDDEGGRSGGSVPRTKLPAYAGLLMESISPTYTEG